MSIALILATSPDDVWGSHLFHSSRPIEWMKITSIKSKTKIENRDTICTETRNRDEISYFHSAALIDHSFKQVPLQFYKRIAVRTITNVFSPSVFCF